MKKLNMIKAIFFDWFNTLACYDPPREELHSQVFHEFNIHIEPLKLLPGILIADKYYFAEVSRLPMVKRNTEEQAKVNMRYAEITLNKAGVQVDQEMLLQIIKKWPQVFNKTRFVLFDDVLTVMEALKKQGFILGLITNASKNAVSAHRELGLEPYLNHIVTSEEAGTDKPDPVIFLLALEKAGVSATEAIHVGDQYDVDIVGARRANIIPIMLDRYDLYPEVTDCPRIKTLHELLKRL
jgi:putative hydrolase of the HAD superfamily